MNNAAEKRDVCGDDSRFGSKPEPKKEPSVTEGAAHLGKGFFYIAKGIGNILLKKVPMNVIFLLIIIGGAVFATIYFKNPTITANVVFAQNESGAVSQDEFSNLLKTNCKVTDWATNLTVACPASPVCQECSVCENTTCPSCEEQIIYRYRCPSGAIVDDSNDCSSLVSIPEIKSAYKKESDGITLSIDGIKVEFNSDNKTGYIKQVNYTIINQGSSELSPKIEVRTYKEWDYTVRAEPPQKLLKPEDIKMSIGVNEWVMKSSPVIILFTGEEKTLRLELFDVTNDESLVTATMPLDFSSYR